MGTTAQKLTYLNNTKQLLKENINNLGGSLTNEPFRQYASVLEGIYERLPKVSGIGASLSLSPSMVGKIKLNEIQGNTLQNGTPTPSSPVPIQSVTGLQNVEVCGKNLLSNLLQNTITYSGTTSTINGDTWTIIKSGTGGISLNPRTEYLPLTIKTGEKVTFSTFPYSGTMTSATVHIQIRVYFYDKDKNLITNMGSGTTSQDSETTILSSTYTATQDVAYIRLGDYIASGTGTTTGLVLKMQLERGDTRTDFESYKGNTYEVNLGNIELNTIGDYEDSIKKSTGVQLFDKSTIIEGKYIDASGNLVNDNSNFVGDYILINNTKSYYIYSDNTSAKRIAYYDSDKTYISREVLGVKGSTLTIPNNTKYVRLSCYNDNLDTLMLNEGSSPLPYEPYGKVWYITENNGIIESYNGETITTDYISTTGELTAGAKIVYKLTSPKYKTITNTTLIEQLETLRKAKSKNGTTNINVTSEDLAMILNVGVLKGE